MPGNERADRLAREVAFRVVLPSPVWCTDVLSIILEVIIAIWHERWNVRGATSKMGEFKLASPTTT